MDHQQDRLHRHHCRQLGADTNWTTPGNWSGGGAAPLAGYTLLFGAGATRKTANNNFPSGTTFAALVFQDSGYTLTGNNLKLSAGIRSTNTAGGTDIGGVNVALTATGTSNIGGTTLIDVTGTISGTKLGIIKTGTGTLAYDSPAGNTYTGLTTVSGGTLQLETSNQITDTASVTVSAGATFDLNGHDETIANLTLTGGTVNTGSGTLTLSGNVTSNAATASATINGKLNLIGAAGCVLRLSHVEASGTRRPPVGIVTGGLTPRRSPVHPLVLAKSKDTAPPGTADASRSAFHPRPRAKS